MVTIELSCEIIPSTANSHISKPKATIFSVIIQPLYAICIAKYSRLVIVPYLLPRILENCIVRMLRKSKIVTEKRIVLGEIFGVYKYRLNRKFLSEKSIVASAAMLFNGFSKSKFASGL